MNSSLVNQIVEAVLYEGYILYPYRASSTKNQQRFTFGRVYPRDFGGAESGAEPCVMQTQCLARRSFESVEPVLRVTVRFLHPMRREVGMLPAPLAEMPAEADLTVQLVPQLRVEGNLYQSWDEVTEREIAVSPSLIGAPLKRNVPFAFPVWQMMEPIRDASGKIVAVISRRQEALSGSIEIVNEPLDALVSRITVRVQNATLVPESELRNQARVLARTFVSTHTILQLEQGEFFSLTDPPENYFEATAACQNIGTWPVLVGTEEKQERDTLLSSPIILYDYPRIAPESAGNLFDGTEIDELLTLRIQTMTDDEKAEMRGADEYARRLLERAEALPNEQLLKMHGAMRSLDALEVERFFNPGTPLSNVAVGGVLLKTGDRVRIRPRTRADAMDMVLDGKAATIEAVEQDLEGRVQFALVLDEDPGRDLGLMRQPGHRFFYSADEVEPL